MKQAATMAWVVAGLTAARLLIAPAGAHPLDEGFGLGVEVFSAEASMAIDPMTGEAGFTVVVGLAIHNNTAETATLFDIRPAIGDSARLIETLRVAGESYEREAALARIEPNEGLVVLPPLAKIVIEGVGAEELRRRSFRMTLDFGAAGAPEILLRLAGPSPYWSSIEGDQEAVAAPAGGGWGAVLDRIPSSMDTP